MKKSSLNLNKVFSNNFFMIRLISKYIPDFIIILILYNIFTAGTRTVNLLLEKRFFDMIEGKYLFYQVALLCVLWFFLVKISITIVDTIYVQIYNPNVRNRFTLNIQRMLYDKARTIEIAKYDSPEFYNDFIWAMSEADSRAFNIAGNMGSLVNAIVSLLGMGYIVVSIEPVLIIYIIAAVIGNTMISMLSSKLEIKKQGEKNPINRKKEYIQRIFYLGDYAKELRMSNVSDELLTEYNKAAKEDKSIIKRYAGKSFLYTVFQNILLSVGFETLIYFILVYKMLVEKSISIGDFAVSFSAIGSFFGAVNNLLSSAMAFPVNSMYIDKVRTFLEYDNKIKSGKADVPAFESIKINNLSFKYESNSDYTLKNVSLEIKKGERIAIVGYNGAGKSTLIKLIMRLYDPDTGNIELNGTDIRDLSLDDYRGKIGAVFQDFQIFASSVAENTVADIYNEDEDKEKVISALEAATFTKKLSALKNGIDTQITREFDENGVNLSGGELQKIAIARVFAKDCELIVMDEPSSALDPISEYELNRSIKENAQGKSVIFISHRLSTTRMADRIYMFENGSIIEQGTHDELMALNGKYAYMFNLQAERYKKHESNAVVAC